MIFIITFPLWWMQNLMQLKYLCNLVHKFLNTKQFSNACLANWLHSFALQFHILQVSSPLPIARRKRNLKNKIIFIELVGWLLTCNYIFGEIRTKK